MSLTTKLTRQIFSNSFRCRRSESVCRLSIVALVITTPIVWCLSVCVFFNWRGLKFTPSLFVHKCQCFLVFLPHMLCSILGNISVGCISIFTFIFPAPIVAGGCQMPVSLRVIYGFLWKGGCGNNVAWCNVCLELQWTGNSSWFSTVFSKLVKNSETFEREYM